MANERAKRPSTTAHGGGLREKGAVIRAVPAVTRAVAILRLLEKAKIPVGLREIANVLDLVPSTCLHISRALVTEDLVAYDLDTRSYSLGTGLLEFARSFLNNDNLVKSSQSALEALAAEFDVTTGLSLPVRDHHLGGCDLGEALNCQP